MSRSGVLDRCIGAAERLASGLLAVVTALTFVSVVLRYAFGWSIPDAFDLSRNLLGILIFWGIAVAGYRGDHITVDLVWGVLPAPVQRALDLFATLCTLGCMAVFAWAMAGKVSATRASAETTYDLHLPIWPFYLLAASGIAVSVALLVLRCVRQLRAPLAPEAPPLPASH
jgi:TRAP-type C4-dicarboxylate transport system permease small subunit